VKTELKVKHQNTTLGQICFGEVFVVCNDIDELLKIKLQQTEMVELLGVLYADLKTGKIWIGKEALKVEVVKGTFKGVL
jgi:hypothetical protein